MTREEWLTKAKDLIVEKIFNPNEIRLPPVVRVSVGPCRGKAIGMCVSPEQSEDGSTNIFISPSLGNESTVEVLATLLHELLHAHVMGEGYLDCGHGSPFKEVIRTCGLAGKPTHTYAEPGSELYATLEGMSAALGEYPHRPIHGKEPKKREKTTIKFISSTNADYVVKIKKTLVEELGVPRDFNGEPMLPENPDELADDEKLGLKIVLKPEGEEERAAE